VLSYQTIVLLGIVLKHLFYFQISERGLQYNEKIPKEKVKGIKIRVLGDVIMLLICIK